MAVLAVVVAGAVLRDINLLVLVAGMMAGPLLINVAYVMFALRKVTVRRNVPESICAGDLLVVDVVAKNARRFRGAWGVSVEDTIERVDAPRRHSERAGVLFFRIPAGETSRASYRGRLMERGEYRFGPLRLTCRFPLGLVRRTIVVGQFDTVTVCPRLGRLTRRWRRLHQATPTGSQHTQRQRGLVEGSFHALRDWRTGDSKRWIHWRTSARRGSLVVREFEQQRNGDLAILLDLWQPKRSEDRDRELVELVVSFAATAVADLCREGVNRLLLASTGKRGVYLHGSASRALLQEALMLLAVVTAQPGDEMPVLLEQVQRDLRPGARTIVLSTRPFAAAHWDERGGPGGGSAADRARLTWIDVSGPELSEYFHGE
jgi:uncharacterized protein (DUF58 family)